MIHIICCAWAIVFLFPFIEETVKLLEHGYFQPKNYLIV